MTRSLAIAVAAGSLALGCAPEPSPAAARATWVVDALVEAERTAWARSPARVAEKWAALAASPHDFLRGTLGLFLADCAAPGGPCPPSRYASRASARVALVGDPHIENLGTWLAGDGTGVREIDVDFNDFDAARYGPYWLDVRRLGLSWAILGDALAPLGGVPAGITRRALARAAAAGYAEAILRFSVGDEPVEPESGPLVLLDDLRDRARNAMETTPRLHAALATQDSAPRLRISTDAQAGDRTIALSPEEHEEVRRCWARAMRTMDLPPELKGRDLELLDAVRRLDVGVASLDALRYLALIRLPSNALRLVDVKEVFDAPGGPPAGALLDRVTDNGQRVVTFQRALQSQPDEDWALGFCAGDRRAFRTVEWSDARRGLTLGRIRNLVARGEATPDDVLALARWSGARLGAAHAMAKDADGAPGGEAVARALRGDPAGFAAECATFADGYADVLLADLASFRRALAARGPDLGAAAMFRSAP